ncbi:MAG: hypothetical protein ACI4R9_06730 [Kiritimatiellia bacterium]
MKRLFAVVAASLALLASAASERIVVIRVADTAGIVSAVTKLGEFIGNPMLVMPLVAGVSANPVVEMFGPGRTGVPIMVEIYFDSAKAPADASPEKQIEEGADFALLYPVTKGKAAFLANNPNATEKDGVITLVDEDDDESSKFSVVFSADDSWAALSCDADCARAALADTKCAATSLGGDLLQVECPPAGISFLNRFIEMGAAETGASRADVEPVLKLLRQGKAFSIAAQVNDAGLTLRSKMVPVAGSDLAKAGKEPLAAGDALAFAGDDAVYARAYGKGCIMADVDFDVWWTKFTSFVAKQGLDMAWLVCTKKGATRTITFDFDNCVKYFKTAGKAKFEALDPEAVVKDFKTMMTLGTGITSDTPAGAYALALKGVHFKGTPAARFARIAPEAAAKKPYMVSVGSFYAALHALAPKLVVLLSEEAAAFAKPLLPTLPPADLGGCAAYSWREGDDHRTVIRISPEEIKGWSVCANIYLTYTMQQMMKTMQMDAFDDADDEDDDADDED